MDPGMESRPPCRHRPVSYGRYARLDAELDARGWTLADLARACGVPYLRLVRTTAGHNPPSLDTMDRTARVFSLRPHELWQKESQAGASVRVGAELD